MTGNTLKLARVLLDRRVTATPLRVLRELRRQGIRRLPSPVDRRLRHWPVVALLGFLRGWLGSEMLTRHRGQWVLNSFVPPFPSEAFNRSFENLLRGRRFNPVSAFLAVTATCPYHCWHCSLATRRTGHLSTAQWLRTIEQLHQMGVSIIGLTGGEPLTREDLPELVAASSKGAASILFTSGAGLDTAKVQALKQAGLWSLCVSLDAPTRAEYDLMRGADGAFDAALQTIRMARTAGFYSMVGAVATRRFVEERWYEGLYELSAQYGVQEVRIVEPMPCGKLAHEQEQHLLLPTHIAALRQFHCRVNRRGRPPKVCAFNQVESPEVFGCSGGIQHMFIDTAGEVCPCDFTPMGFGNVTSEPLADVVDRMQQALGRPRRNCIIQTNHALIEKYHGLGYPLPPEVSCEVCRQLPKEGLPGYYELVMQDQSNDGQGT